MASVDFRGIEGVLGAYKARGIDTWAVFNKKCLMQSGSDEQSLSDYLDLMRSHNSGTVYRLQVYRNLEADDVTDKSECNGAITFLLSEEYQPGYMRGNMTETNSVSMRLAAIEKKLNGEGAAKEPTIMGTVLGWISTPEDLVTTIGAIGMIKNIVTGKGDPAQMLQAVSALGAAAPRHAGAEPAQPLQAVPAEPGDYELTPQQQETIQRFAIVIDRLEKVDPDILLHLQQLAVLAETNPPMYKMALNFLPK